MVSSTCDLLLACLWGHWWDWEASWQPGAAAAASSPSRALALPTTPSASSRPTRQLSPSGAAAPGGWRDLHSDVLEEVVRRLDPSWRGVARHVSRGYRAAVATVAQEGGQRSLGGRSDDDDDDDGASSPRLEGEGDDSLNARSGEGALSRQTGVARQSWSGAALLQPDQLCGSMDLLQWAAEQGCCWEAGRCLERAAGGPPPPTPFIAIHSHIARPHPVGARRLPLPPHSFCPVSVLRVILLSSEHSI